jgi:hypothetical protein
MNNDPSETTSQEAREQDYLTCGVFKEKTDAGDLHMFFSPYIVPAGLTDDEVKFCLELHKQRERISKYLLKNKKDEIKAFVQKGLADNYVALEKQRLGLSGLFGEFAFGMTAGEIAVFISTMKVVMYWPIPLPLELVKSPMTRDSFASGTKKLIDYMNTFYQ